MEKNLSKEQVKTILLNAPKGSDNSLIIEGLVNKGYVLEGFNDQQAQPVVQKPLTEKIGNVVSSVFPGDKIGNVIGTEIAKATATPEERQFIQQDVKPREIAGEALQIGAMIFPFGKVANVASKVAGKTAGKIASGVAGGFMADVGFNLEDENKTLAEAFIPGVGTAIGAAIPAIGPVSKALKSTQTPEKVIGRVLQGKTKDVPLAEKAFKNINLSNINTRQELSERLNQAMETQMQKVDEFLAKDSRKLSLDDYAIRAVNDAGQEVKTDFISNALNTLEDFYKNAGDELSASNVNLLKQRALEEGLTHQEVNNLSRIYSEEFGKKAFSKLGEPLTSVNAQMFENTRKGLKQAARGGLGYGKEAQEADRLYSAMNNTKRIIDAGVEGVNKLEQRLKDYNVLQQLSRTAVKALNTFTGGSLKAGVEALGVSNVGNKIDNWVNLEKTLRKDLEFIQKANGINTEKGLVNAIEKWAKNVQFPGDKIIDKIKKKP